MENFRTRDGGCDVCVLGRFFLVTLPVPAAPPPLPWDDSEAPHFWCPPNLGTANSLRMADLVATQPRKFCLWLGAPVAEPE